VSEGTVDARYVHLVQQARRFRARRRVYKKTSYLYNLPGLNTISLRIVLPNRGVVRGSPISVVLDMPGMAMPPPRTALTARGADYRGHVVVPMFGRYRAQVDATIAGGRYTGTVSLNLPLTLASPTASGRVARP
jgi:hypothetical protein